ncbi:MAG: hypothetical protein FJW38_09750 [Acidobacteria bacterium]|nr:hypothetical protein [Acidobacteriota bacterium]
MMRLTVERIPEPDFGGFTTRAPGIPAYGEGETEEEAMADLKEALIGYVETFGLEETMARVDSPETRTSEARAVPPKFLALLTAACPAVSGSPISLRQIALELDEPVRA